VLLSTEGWTKGFIDIFSRRATSWFSQAGFFLLSFFLKKTFLWMVKPGGQYHPHSWPVCPFSWHLMKLPLKETGTAKYTLHPHK